jgi:hypothetical protein
VKAKASDATNVTLIALRIAFGTLALAGLWVAISTMVRLSWGLDVAIAAVAVVAFSYYFEQDGSLR